MSKADAGGAQERTKTGPAISQSFPGFPNHRLRAVCYRPMLQARQGLRLIALSLWYALSLHGNSHGCLVAECVSSFQREAPHLTQEFFRPKQLQVEHKVLACRLIV
jgi:hypothetical protein